MTRGQVRLNAAMYSLALLGAVGTYLGTGGAPLPPQVLPFWIPVAVVFPVTGTYATTKLIVLLAEAVFDRVRTPNHRSICVSESSEWSAFD